LCAVRTKCTLTFTASSGAFESSFHTCAPFRVTILLTFTPDYVEKFQGATWISVFIGTRLSCTFAQPKYAGSSVDSLRIHSYICCAKCLFLKGLPFQNIVAKVQLLDFLKLLVYLFGRMCTFHLKTYCCRQIKVNLTRNKLLVQINKFVP